MDFGMHKKRGVKMKFEMSNRKYEFIKDILRRLKFLQKSKFIKLEIENILDILEKAEEENRFNKMFRKRLEGFSQEGLDKIYKIIEEELK